jgi:hypothetical protein
MNSTIAIESSIRPSGLGRRLRAAIASWGSKPQRVLTREELMELREQRLLAERLLEQRRTSAYAARVL